MNSKRILELAGVIDERGNLDVPHKKWKRIEGKTLDKYKEEILALIVKAYKDVGGNARYKTANDISTKDFQAWEVIDLDDDPDIDAVSVSKKRKAGEKLVAIGHDGSKVAKTSVLNHDQMLLKKSGYYAEVSGKIYDIFKNFGVKTIDDEKIVRSVLSGEDIIWNGDGTYKRKIAGKYYTKVLVGNPKKV